MNVVGYIFQINKFILCGIYPVEINFTDLPLYFCTSKILHRLDIAKMKNSDLFRNNFSRIFPKINRNGKLPKKIKNFPANYDFGTFFQFKENRNTKKEKSIKDLKKKLRFIDYAGIEIFLPDIQKFIICPILNFRLYRERNLRASSGILLSGPPGCGKSLLVHVIAGELNLPIFYLSPYKINNSFTGINEKKLQNFFNLASKNSPSIVLLEELDMFASKIDSESRSHERKFLRQLILSIDKIKKNPEICVIIFATTNVPEQIDDAIRRPGRIDNEIEFRIPCFSTRLKLIENMLMKFSFEIDFTPQFLALNTKGYVSGDIFQLITLASNFTIFRLSNIFISSTYRRNKKVECLNFSISYQDLEKAKILIDSSLIKNGFNIIPETRWSDIGALNQVKKVLSKYIIEPIRFPEKKISKYDTGVGLLLYGPPGCGKTLLVNAVVKESGANFIFVKGPEILNKFLGESEKGIRKIFFRAKMFNPTIIFFDEFDSIASKRELSENSTNSSSNDRVVNQLLTEIDSIEKEKRVYFIGATNRPSCIDKALLRPGRIDKIISVPYPNLEGKFLILKTILKKINHLPYLNLTLFFRILKENITGAELNLALKDASIDAGKNSIKYFFLFSSTTGLSIDYFNLIGTKNFHYGLNSIIKNRDTKNQLV